MSTNLPLPDVLARIAAVAGLEAALTLAVARGGTQIYVPPAPTADHWLSKLLGHEAAQAICAELTCGVGPARIDLPLGNAGSIAQRQAEIDRMIADGMSESAIALRAGCTARTVRRRRAMLGQVDDRQLSLL